MTLALGQTAPVPGVVDPSSDRRRRRSIAWGLTVGGADGVARVLDVLRQDVEIALTLAGGLEVVRR